MSGVSLTAPSSWTHRIWFEGLGGNYWPSTSNEEYSVNTTFNYIHYSMSTLVGSFTIAADFADDVYGTGSILNINWPRLMIETVIPVGVALLQVFQYL